MVLPLAKQPLMRTPSEINNNIQFGGIKRLEYQFNDEQNKLIKTVYNAN